MAASKMSVSLPAELRAWVEEEAARSTEGRVSPVLQRALHAYRAGLERRDAGLRFLQALDQSDPVSEQERRRLEHELDADLTALG
ncbi:MAG: hypothetical protein GXP55_20320 [Deltaproteobacteria bacterium]|nr:hypothetical protein [Deltaproteobacteria bacterium]